MYSTLCQFATLMILFVVEVAFLSHFWQIMRQIDVKLLKKKYKNDKDIKLCIQRDMQQQIRICLADISCQINDI